MKRCLLVVGAVLSVGCGGRVSTLGSDGAGLGGSAGPTASGVDVASACAAPMTDTFEPRTGAAFARAIVGRWIVCNANPQSAS
ncbi:MAG TPA: hypothetical protein VIF62_40130, partial [Labilithrix sp.]